MKYIECKCFRDLYLKYVEVSNVSDEIKSGLDIEDLTEPYFGFVYIDHEYGLTLRIFGNATNYIDTDELLVRSEGFGDMNFKVIDESLLAPTEEKKERLDRTKSYYIDEELERVRQDKKLDSFRHSDFIDDVKVILPAEAGFETLWVRLEFRADQDDIYFGKLLNSSELLDAYKVGLNVAVQYFKDYEKDKDVLVLRGILKENEEGEN